MEIETQEISGDFPKVTQLLELYLTAAIIYNCIYRTSYNRYCFQCLYMLPLIQSQHFCEVGTYFYFRDEETGWLKGSAQPAADYFNSESSILYSGDEMNEPEGMTI